MVTFLDNNSTTQVDPRIAKYASHLLSTVFFANTTSTHCAGLQCNGMLETCRAKIAELLGAESNQVVFTSCATESNNIVILGCVQKVIGMHHRKPVILYAATEHVSVLNPIRFCTQHGIAESHTIPVKSDGLIDLSVLAEMCSTTHPDLVTVSHINNEVGTLQDVKALAEIAHKHGALFHTDATQSIGKVPLHASEMNVDFATWSSHKIYSVSGCGGIVVRDTDTLQQIMYGNDNEFQLRPGSTNLFGIMCMTKALELCCAEMQQTHEHLVDLTRHLFAEFKKRNVPYQLNSVHPFAINVTFPTLAPMTSDTLVQMLSARDICVSRSSACKSRSKQESYVLDAMGVKQIGPHIRIGIGKFNTPRDVTRLVKTIKSIMAEDAAPA